jgi:hypothetical protein
MLAIFGTVIGLLGSFLPELLKFFNNKEDHKHEVEVFKLQTEAAKIQHEAKMKEIDAYADIAEAMTIHESAKQVLTGAKWLDGIISLYNSSVRPTITYAFMFLYMAVKYGIYTSYTTAGYSWTQAVQIIWGQDDFAVFSTIIAFWFGSRMMKATMQRYANSK